MNEKSRIMALVMTALLVIGALSAIAPVMSGTSITNNEGDDTYITTQTIDPGDSVKLMNFTIGASGDQHITGYSISPGTQLLQTPPDSWTNAGSDPIMYHDPTGGDAWDAEADILAFDNDDDGYWTAQADLSLAGLSINQAAALTGMTETNPWAKVMFKNYDADAWQSGQDAIIYDKDGDGVYSAMADTVIQTGNDATVDVTTDTNVSSMPTGFYMTSGKDDVVNNDFDDDGRFTAQPDTLLDEDGTGSSGPGAAQDVAEGDTLSQFVSGDDIYLLDLDEDGGYFDTNEIFIFDDSASGDGEWTEGTDAVILDQNTTNTAWFDGWSALNAQARNTRLKYFDVGTTGAYVSGDDIVLDDGGYNTFSTQVDTVINDGGSREISNKDILTDITTMYAGDSPMFADLDESGYTYTAGDEIFLDNDGDTSYTAEADILLAGTAPSNGITLVNTNPWMSTTPVDDPVTFVDDGSGVWEASKDCIFLDYHNGDSISVEADTEIAGNVTGEDGAPLTEYTDGGADWDLDFYNMYPGGEWTPSQDAIIEDADGNDYYQDVLTNIEIDNTEGLYPLGLEGDQVTFHVWKDLKPSDGHNMSDTANETQLANPVWDATNEVWTLSLSEDIIVDTTVHVYMETSADITGDPKITPMVTTTFVSGTDDFTSANTVTVDGPPGVQWARTADNDNDGMVDHIHVNYTELMGVTGIGTLNDVTFDNATIVDLSRDETWGTTLIMYELENQKPPEWTSYADFDETFITDDTGKNLASGQDQPVVDWVGPYLESCEVEIGARAATVTFSENVDSYGSGTYDEFITSGSLSVVDWSLSGATEATLIFNRAVVGTDIGSTINTGQGDRDSVSGVALTDATDEYSLVTGWNVVSIPRAVAGTLDLADNATGVISNMWAFDAQNQEWYHPTTVEPLDAVFVYAEGPQQITFTYKTPEPTDTPPTKEMYAGWNFVGPNMDPTSETQVTVNNLLASVAGQYSVVFSPVFNHGGSWTVTPNNAASQTMKCFEGYWVYMNSDGTLAGRSA